MKKLLLLYNPNSGKGQIKNHLSNIIQIFSEADYEVTVYPTKKSLDGKEKVIKEDGKYDIIVCSGGDGTLNEIVSGLMECQKKVPIGYIPSGSTNDFAATLNLSKSMKQAAKDIVNGKVIECDIGIFNGRYFNYIAGVGAFTEVSYDTSQNLKNVLGHQAYWLESIRSIPNIKPFTMTIETEDGIETGEFMYGMITNSEWVGGIKKLPGKHVVLNDGYFELNFIRKTLNPLDFQTALSDLISGNRTSKAIYNKKIRNVKLTSDRDLAWVLDGEYGGLNREVRISVGERAFEIIVKK